MDDRPENLQSGEMPRSDDWNNLVEKAWTPPAPQFLDLRNKNTVVETVIIGVLDEDLTYHGTATLSVWDKSGGTWGDTGNNEEVEDRFGTTGKKIASGCWIGARKIGDVWVADVSSCCLTDDTGT